MFSLFMTASQSLPSSLVATAADTAAGFSLEDLSQPLVVFIMTGLTILVPTVSGVLIYHSLNMAHTQHGHDDH